AAWEARRRVYAAGWKRPTAVDARVVSVGNLTIGGTGKTTLTLRLARRLAGEAVDVAGGGRRYGPGRARLGAAQRRHTGARGAERVYGGTRKLELARRAARDGRRVILVDDGFSHWPLARDLDLVLLEARDPFGGDQLLPLGRLREPHRALQRADAVIVSRVA